MGIPGQLLVAQPDLLHQLLRPGVALGGRADLLHIQRFPDAVPNRKAGVQRGIGVLENDLHFLRPVLKIPSGVSHNGLPFK